MPPPDAPSVLVIGCGALATEILDVVVENRLENIRVECLPAILHNRPEKIPGAVRAKLEAANDQDRVFVAYGDCGTGGKLDEVLEEYGVERLPGDHCYQFYAGIDQFREIHDQELGTFFLTDYLAHHFDRLIWRGLGLDRWPELRDEYFKDYKRVVYLAQQDDPSRTEGARLAAQRLGLEFERRYVGYGELQPALVQLTRSKPVTT